MCPVEGERACTEVRGVSRGGKPSKDSYACQGTWAFLVNWAQPAGRSRRWGRYSAVGTPPLSFSLPATARANQESRARPLHPLGWQSFSQQPLDISENALSFRGKKKKLLAAGRIARSRAHSGSLPRTRLPPRSTQPQSLNQEQALQA